VKKTNRFAKSRLMGWTLIVVGFALLLGCSTKEEYTAPAPATVEIADISYLKEMDGNRPAHEGETISIEGVVTMGTGVMVSGRFVKFHIQDATGGAYVFADTQAQEAVVPQQAGGSSFEGIEVYEGDLVRIRGEIGSHDGMIEFHPLSGGSIAVRGSGQPQPTPHLFRSVDAIYASEYAKVGDLVRVNGVEIQGDPSDTWPEYGQKASGEKAIELKTARDSNTLYAAIYPGSGIPGSTPPEGIFDIVGVLHRGEASYTIYPRALYDINPSADTPLTGHAIWVYKDGQPKEQGSYVSVDDLPQCTYDTGRQGGLGPEPIATLASFILPEVVTDPKDWEYRIVASDGQKPWNNLQFNQMKSGLVYEGEEADVLWSHFYEGMGLSRIYFLEELAEIVLYRPEEGPATGDATYGEGITLAINETSYPVNFEDLPNPGLTERPLADFVPDNIIDKYTSSKLSYDQIRDLYDYRLIPYGDGGGCFPVTWDEIDPEEDPPMVSLSDQAPFATVTGLAGCGQIDDLVTIQMVRKVIVDEDPEDDVQGQVIYWEDPALPKIEFEGEEVVFLDDLLDFVGIPEDQKVRNDYNLVASDGFNTYFPYGHHHLVDMYFRPLENETYVTNDNPEMRTSTYAGRYSVKALLKIELSPIQEEAPSLFIEGLGWLSDPVNPDTCNGCHVKKRGDVVTVNIEVNCAQCHDM
jgi:hypothetical protein